MAGVQLSEGALQDIMRGSQPDNPIMQVLSTKRIASNSVEKERYRVLLSDGRHHISFAMLTTQMNHKVTSGDLTNNCIIKMLRYVTSVINNSTNGDKRVLIIMDLEVLVPGSQSEKIGNPLPLADTAITAASGPSSEPRPVPRQSTSVQSNNVSTTAKFTGADLNMSLANQMVLPISSLSPYQNRWVIKARVAFKSAIRTWSNARGEGKLFSMDLCDESGEIRATAFKEQVDKFYDYIEVDKVYFISKCILKVANKQFTTIKNDYEMTFTNDTVLQDCPDDDARVPKVAYNFVSIDQVTSHDAGGVVDIIGVCKSVGDLQRFVSKAGKDLIKREVALVDQSNTSVMLTLWGNDAETFDGSNQPIILVKGARVGEFGGGKTVSLFGGSQMKVNPDIEESHRLRGWFDNGGCNVAVKDISARSEFGGSQTPWVSFREARDNPEWGKSEKGDFFQAKVTVLSAPLNEKSVYKSCTNNDCKRKVIDLENGLFRCEKCNIESATFTYRLLGRMQVGDSTGSQWVNMFSDEAEKVFGKTAQEIGELINSKDNEGLSAVATDANFREFTVKCRSKVESFNDEQRVKTVAVRVEPVNYKEYNSQLLTRIRSHLN